MCRILKGKVLADIQNSFDRITRKEVEAGEITVKLNTFAKNLSDLQLQEEMMLQRSNEMGNIFLTSQEKAFGRKFLDFLTFFFVRIPQLWGAIGVEPLEQDDFSCPIFWFIDSISKMSHNHKKSYESVDNVLAELTEDFITGCTSEAGETNARHSSDIPEDNNIDENVGNRPTPPLKLETTKRENRGW
ncbi:unnamed protein product [Vicia faba]|uniref:Uncharacterized protein n=1 Tax=Vicia faba TaxID=3906 RepID=A0AAV0ZW03_VICFA|nr:unnamed protein product [Vicia faba]